MAINLKKTVTALGALGLLLLLLGLYKTVQVVRISNQLSQIAEARLQVATGHIYLEEILGGDEHLVQEDILTYFRRGGELLRAEESAHDADDAALSRPWASLEEAADQLTALAATRMRSRGGGAGSELDQSFDGQFDAFIADADLLLTLLKTRMQDAAAFLRWQTAAVLTVFVIFMVLLFRLIRDTERSAARQVANARVEQKNEELSVQQEMLANANRQQNFLLELSAKCQSINNARELSDVVLRELGTECRFFAGMVWLVCESGQGAAVSSLMIDRSRLPTTMDGVVAQVAKSRVAMSSTVPPGYFSLDDPVLKTVEPGFVHILPLVCMERVVAVVELGFMQPPEARVLKFLEEALQAFAVRYYLFAKTANDERDTGDGVPAERPGT